MIYIFTVVLGLIIGSFIAAFTYRFPRGIQITKGRSRCDNCKKEIAWFDNFPLLSYLRLGGRCRFCKAAISPRYPIIEASVAVLFLALILRLSHSPIEWLSQLGLLADPFILVMGAIFAAIFIIDWEHQIIPDALTFVGLAATFVAFILSNNDQIYTHLFTGLSAALFLLIIHLVTRGRGMGLGDVKFAILGGLILGPLHTIAWIMLSFIIGGIVGLFLIFNKKAALKDKIAFGPFLIAAFFVIFFTNITFWVFGSLL